MITIRKKVLDGWISQYIADFYNSTLKGATRIIKNNLQHKKPYHPPTLISSEKCKYTHKDQQK